MPASTPLLPPLDAKICILQRWLYARVVSEAPRAVTPPRPQPERREQGTDSGTGHGATPQPKRLEQAASRGPTPQPERREQTTSHGATPQPERREPEQYASCGATPQPERREPEQATSRGATPQPEGREQAAGHDELETLGGGRSRPVGSEELESDYEDYYATGKPMEVEMEMPDGPVADPGPPLRSEFLAFAAALQGLGPLKAQQLVGIHPPKFAYTTSTGIC